jgi:replicative DNA helicase
MTAQVVSKEIDKRQNKRPHLADIYGSSALQRDAYFIGTLYRDDFYNPDTTERPNIGEVIVRAHRDGPTATVDLYFNAPLAKFSNLQRQEINL